MGKGCFIKFIIILTIVIAAVLYIVQNKFNDLVIGPGKKLIKIAFNDSWQEELAYVRDSPQKDTLKILINNYIDKITNVKDISEKEIEHIQFAIESIVTDSIIDQEDLGFLRKTLRVENERSKKD